MACRRRVQVGRLCPLRHLRFPRPLPVGPSALRLRPGGQWGATRYLLRGVRHRTGGTASHRHAPARPLPRRGAPGGGGATPYGEVPVDGRRARDRVRPHLSRGRAGHGLLPLRLLHRLPGALGDVRAHQLILRLRDAPLHRGAPGDTVRFRESLEGSLGREFG